MKLIIILVLLLGAVWLGILLGTIANREIKPVDRTEQVERMQQQQP